MALSKFDDDYIDVLKLYTRDVIRSYRVSAVEEEFLRSFRKPTVQDVERAVSRLHSISDAGRDWIVDERCRELSIGRHHGKITFKMRTNDPPKTISAPVYTAER